MTEAKRKFQGVWIPADIWLNRDLTLTDKVMLVEIASLEADERGCYASNAYFGEFFNLSPSRVSEVINALAKAGYLRIELKREGKRIIERNIFVNEVFGKPKGYSENAEKGIRKTEEGYSENAEGSNTKINNTKSSKESLSEAFELFWKSTHKNGSKKKAGELFAGLVKRLRADPMEFAAMLVNDVNARNKAGQFGFDKLHITTYLNQERWSDTITASTTNASSINQPFAETDYKGSDNDQFADFLNQP